MSNESCKGCLFRCIEPFNCHSVCKYYADRSEENERNKNGKYAKMFEEEYKKVIEEMIDKESDYKKLEILKQSLAKKEQELQRRFDVHFATVKQANGQPLNDKRNGQATLNKWEKQNNAIRNLKDSIEKTKSAIPKIAKPKFCYFLYPDTLQLSYIPVHGRLLI